MTAVTTDKGSKIMEFLISVGILVIWFALQAWVLPRFGVNIAVYFVVPWMPRISSGSCAMR
ncbi:MAG: hypothetical protein WKF77_15150 [Planctomycetaceae bacterium]